MVDRGEGGFGIRHEIRDGGDRNVAHLVVTVDRGVLVGGDLDRRVLVPGDGILQRYLTVVGAYIDRGIGAGRPDPHQGHPQEGSHGCRQGKPPTKLTMYTHHLLLTY